MRRMGAGTILLLAAIIVFILAGVGVTVGNLDEMDEISFGLAIGFASFLVP